MISASFITAPSSGNVYETDFTFFDTTSSENLIVKRIWDFGDSTKEYNTKTPTHSYNYPGTYIVSLSTFDILGNFQFVSKPITVEYVYGDCLEFTELPDDYAIPGHPTATPFKISLTSAQINVPIFVDLYAANSQTTPYETVPEKWRFLTPTWRFLDKNLTPTTTLSVAVDNLYLNNKVVAVSGASEFYYVDDKCSGSTSDPYSKCPILITATLQTSGFIFPKDSKVFNYPSYANNNVIRAGVIWNVYSVIPTHLKITGNYLENVYPYKWTNIKTPFLITIHSNRKNYLQGSEEKESGILFVLPQSNEQGKLATVQVSLCGTNQYTIDEAPLYFQSLDKNGLDSGGYLFTTLTPLSPINSTTISASTTIFLNQESNINQFAYPLGCSPNVFAWVSNPENKTLHKVFLPPYPDNCDTINAFKYSNNLIDGYIKTITVPSIDSTSTYNYYMSGFAGIYAMAIDPRQHDVYATDAELDRIYKFSNTGTLLSTVQLSSFGGYSPVLGAYTPSNICIDKNYNIYVSLFNTVSVLKFDQNLNFLYTLLPIISTYNIFDGDFVHKPSMVETDRENNVWVTYSNPASSALVKYSGTTGTTLLSVLMPASSPVSLAVTVDNNLWVAQSFNTSLDQGLLSLYNSSGILLSTVSGYTHPGYLSVDKYDNLWFIYGVRNIGCISKYNNASSATLSSDYNWSAYGWELNDDGTTVSLITSSKVSSNTIIVESVTPSATGVEPPPPYDRNNELEGLAVDVFNRLWILDSVSNKIFTITIPQIPIPISIGTTPRSTKIRPDSLIGYYVDANVSFTYTLTSEYNKSLQANGDWTGNRWYQKYFNPTSLTAIPVTGNSAPFSVNTFTNSNQIRLLNENFDTAAHYKDLALPEVLNRNTVFFDTFLGAVVGNNQLSATEDIGRTVYERIANFIFTHGDVDTCNIRQLLSYAQETDTYAFDYGTDFPPEIQRYLDIVSTPRNRLYGLKSPLPILNRSVGPRLTTNTLVTAGNKVFLQNRSDGNDITLITLPVLSGGETVYQLTDLQLPGYAYPLIPNYIFLDFVPVYSDKFIENYIDWENPQTTLSPYLSSEQELYGDKGIIENTFNYLLTKNIIVK